MSEKVVNMSEKVVNMSEKDRYVSGDRAQSHNESMREKNNSGSKGLCIEVYRIVQESARYIVEIGKK